MTKLFSLFTVFLLFTFSYNSNKWANIIGYTDSDQNHALIADSLENIYITGSHRRTLDFTPNPIVSSYSTIYR